MRESLNTVFDSFCQNRDVIKKAFAWERTELYPVCALMFASEGRSATREALDDCRRLIREKTGIFSNFRSTALPVLASMMAVSSDPEGRLASALELHTALRKRFAASLYLPVAAMLLSPLVGSDNDGFAERTREVYDLMKKDHPMLTGEEDVVFAGMLALDGAAPEVLTAQAEECYGLLKQTFRSRDAVQSLSQLLSLFEGTAEEKCAATVELYQKLEAQGYRYGRDKELAVLGVAACLGQPSRSVADDIAAVADRLKTAGGYGFFGIGRRERLLHAAMIVTADISADAAAQMGISAGINAAMSAVIASQHAALCAAITVSTATAAARASAAHS